MFGSEMKFTHFEKSFEPSASGFEPFASGSYKIEQIELSLSLLPAETGPLPLVLLGVQR
jgi:hypothetical protein